MPFLSRRKSTQPADVPPYELQKAVTLPPVRPPPSKVVHDVTRPSAPRYSMTEPVLYRSVGRPVQTARSATTGSGATTPASSSLPSIVTGSSTGRRHDVPSNRTKDLDRIDELDETNPWGISLHHGGPYEAASQALRDPERKKPLAFGDNAYHQRAMQAHGNVKSLFSRSATLDYLTDMVIS